MAEANIATTTDQPTPVVAVTGANGMVGTALCPYLEERNIATMALSRPEVDFHSIDSITDALSGADTVIHLIAKTHSDQSLDQLPAYREINVELTERVLQAAHRANIKRFIYVSSIKALGETTNTTPFSHTSQPHPDGAYGLSKLEAEQRVQARCCEFDIEWIVVRPPLVFAREAQGNIAFLLKALQLGLPLPLASIRNKRHIVELEDLCQILLRCVTIKQAANTTLLAATLPALSTPELIRKLAKENQLTARMLPAPAWALQLVFKGLGKPEQARKLLGNLELDDSYTRKVLGL